MNRCSIPREEISIVRPRIRDESRPVSLSRVGNICRDGETDAIETMQALHVPLACTWPSPLRGSYCAPAACQTLLAADKAVQLVPWNTSQREDTFQETRSRSEPRSATAARRKTTETTRQGPSRDLHHAIFNPFNWTGIRTSLFSLPPWLSIPSL